MCPGSNARSTARKTVAVPWAEKYGRFTRLFERFAIAVLKVCSISEAAGILRISWDEGDGIKARAVKRGLERKPVQVNKALCVDEKSAARGQQRRNTERRVARRRVGNRLDHGFSD